MRIMSMDVGNKRIGIAVSDPLGITAQGLDTIVRTNKDTDIKKVGELIQTYQPDKIVIGLPKNMNGSIGEQGTRTQKFGELLESTFSIEVVYWDERLTTVSATRALIDGNVRRDKRKKQVDKLAAVLILQSYLDYLSR